MSSGNLATWVAIALTTGGGLLTTAIHFGSTNQQIAALETKQAETEAHVAKHDDQLAKLSEQSASIKQSVEDIKDTVHDMRDNGVKRK